jgi:hypothetical protein
MYFHFQVSIYGDIDLQVPRKTGQNFMSHQGSKLYVVHRVKALCRTTNVEMLKRPSLNDAKAHFI